MSGAPYTSACLPERKGFHVHRYSCQASYPTGHPELTGFVCILRELMHYNFRLELPCVAFFLSLFALLR